MKFTFRLQLKALLQHTLYITIHGKNFMVILTNTNGYLSCKFALSTLGIEQRYKECVRYVGYPPSNMRD